MKRDPTLFLHVTQTRQRTQLGQQFHVANDHVTAVSSPLSSSSSLSLCLDKAIIWLAKAPPCQLSSPPRLFLCPLQSGSIFLLYSRRRGSLRRPRGPRGVGGGLGWVGVSRVHRSWIQNGAQLSEANAACPLCGAKAIVRYAGRCRGAGPCSRPPGPKYASICPFLRESS